MIGPPFDRPGLVVSPGFIPDAAELHALQPAYLRSILYTLSDLDRLKATGFPLLLTLSNEFDLVENWANWDHAIQVIAERSDGRVWGVNCGNEFDLFWQHNPADVSPAFAADLAIRASRILQPFGIKTIPTSVTSSKWQEYLAELAYRCRDHVDYFDFHPYGQRPTGWGRPGWFWGDLAVSLPHAREITGKPVICSEGGVKIGDAGGEQQVADFLRATAATVASLGPDVCPAYAWFAWRDQVGAPSERGSDAFGLLAEDGRRRSAWYAFASLSVGIPVPPPVVIPPVEVPPMPPPQFTVGYGVLTAMAEAGDQPATDELYHPIGAALGKHQYSETFGTSGTRYVYVFSVNRTFKFHPDPVPV